MAEAGSLVSDLLQDHSEAINDLLSRTRATLTVLNDDALHEAATEYPLDELNALKFLLSAQRRQGKALETASINLLETLKFRKEHKILLKRAREAKEITYYLPGKPGGFLGDYLVAITDFGQTDMSALARSYGTQEKAVLAGFFGTEQARYAVDKRTRETGRLCKFLSVVNLEGLSLTRIYNRMIFSTMAAVSKHNDVNTPQLLGKVVIVNSPKVLNVLMSMVRPFLSKATMEKTVLCGKRTSDMDASLCPFVSRFLNGAASIPPDLGGTFAQHSDQ